MHYECFAQLNLFYMISINLPLTMCHHMEKTEPTKALVICFNKYNQPLGNKQLNQYNA
jgi:hypothetical protein